MMSWIRSSEGAVALTLLVVLAGITGTAAALSTSAEGVPESAEVGSEVTVTVTVEDPYTDAPDNWELQGETELENVSWTVTELDQGQQVSQDTYGGQSFSQALSRADGGDAVEVQITGTVPAIEEYSYEPAESTTLVRLSRKQGDNTNEIGNWTTRPYTAESQEARDAIDSASTAVEESGGEDARRSLEQAISAYDNGVFENAVSNAEDAESTAQGAKQTQMLLYGGLGVVALAAVVGGVWYWRNQQDDYDKLR